MTQGKTLADRVLPGEGLAWDAARVAAANLLMVLCAWMAVPLPWTPVPVTGQTFGVLLIAALLGARRAAVVLGIYLLEGLAGMPVFQPFGAPGAARLAGPTAGYLLAYPAAAFVTGWLAARANYFQGRFGSLIALWGSLLAGELVIFAAGCAWLAVGLGMGWGGALAAGAAPFAGGELLKMALVAALVRGMERARS